MDLEDNNPVDIAWLAGLFEGEGYVGRTTNGLYWPSGEPKRYLQLTITQKGPETANLIRNMSGFGGVGQCVGVHRERNQWVYRLHGTKVRRFIGVILPYMRLPHKVAQATKALAEDAIERSWTRKTVRQQRTDGKKNWVYPGTNGHGKPRSGVLQ